MKVKIKKLLPEAIIPKYAKEGDAALDLFLPDAAVKCAVTTDYIQYNLGVAVEIPKGFVGLIFPRSSITATDYTLANSVGVIDSGYRGELIMRFRYNKANMKVHYSGKDRIGQLLIIPYPEIELEEVEELSETERSTGGFGHTGK